MERFCNSCETSLPDGAAYCPTCGEPTPTELNRATGEAVRPSGSDLDGAAYRRRLQRAIGKGYQLGDLIGQGGFGVVYSALDIELNREVAVKALRHDAVSSSALFQRFKREARAAAKLRHPHIVPIYAVGEGEGIAFMIMPKLVGESLNAYIRREAPVPVAEAQRILVDASRALAVAHRAGIVHRDVKPENIFLEGEERRVYLMDFGIAKALDTEEEGLTGTGMIVGTPSYMSPEQSGGRGGIDHRTDIYSLGVVGYQLITGQLPYQGESLQELIFQQVTTTPASVTQLRPDVPSTVGQAVDRCLRDAPEERWTTADDLAEALEGGALTSVAPARRRWMRPVAAATVVALLGAAGYLGLQARGGNGDTGAEYNPIPAGVAAGDSGDVTAVVGEDSVGQSTEAAVPVGTPTRDSTQPQPQPQVEPPSPAQTVQRPAPPPVVQADPVPADTQVVVGYLTVNPRVGWARVYIDGVFVDNAPLRRHALSPGRYVIALRKPGYRERVDTVTITAGNELPLSPILLELP